MFLDVPKYLNGRIVKKSGGARVAELVLDARVSAELDEVSRELRVRPGKAICQAVSFLLLYAKAKREGGCLVWENSKGEQREVVLDISGL